MFSISLAYVVFIAISIVGVLLVMHSFLRSEIEAILYPYNWSRIGVVFLAWAVSGIYIWG